MAENGSILLAIDTMTRKRCWAYQWVLEFDIKGYFDNLDKRSVDSILINARYFDGEFKNAFDELKQLVSLESLVSLDTSKVNSIILITNACNIYEMEGEALYAANFDVKINNIPRLFPYSLLYLVPEPNLIILN